MKKYRQLNQNDFDHQFALETRWGDMDGLGHINHAMYLAYMETARVEYYSSLGFSDIRMNQDPSTILGGINIEYINQIEHPAQLIICHRINRVGFKSFDFLGAIFQNDETHPSFAGIFKMISFDYNNQKTVEVPQIIRNRCWYDR
ncbi:MAG: acyl-CoA thioesterase [Fidelibacterota bacterium]